jgi:hypothetical protein
LVKYQSVLYPVPVLSGAGKSLPLHPDAVASLEPGQLSVRAAKSGQGPRCPLRTQQAGGGLGSFLFKEKTQVNIFRCQLRKSYFLGRGSVVWPGDG